jgi:phage/plasmid primase-like uncharacterized protein
MVDAMKSAGMPPDESIEGRLTDGDLIRFRVRGDGPRRRNGWAILRVPPSDSHPPSGQFGWWRGGIRERWQMQGQWQPRTAAQRAEDRREQARLRAKRATEVEAAQSAAAAIWRNAISPTGTPAEVYLRNRGITMPLPPALRFARLALGCSDPMPCLVALVTGGDGNPCAIQRTFLTEDGRKAPLPNPKMSRGPVRGGAIRLGPAAPEVILTEGLEDGLTLQQELGGAVWAVTGTAMMPLIKLPPDVTSVVIGADGDEPGEAAARKAAEAIVRTGRRVRIIRPLDGFKDFNDELRGVAR